MKKYLFFKKFLIFSSMDGIIFDNHILVFLRKGGDDGKNLL